MQLVVQRHTFSEQKTCVAKSERKACVRNENESKNRNGNENRKQKSNRRKQRKKRKKSPTLLRPDELGVDGLAAVDDDALACAEAVFYCEEVCPCGDLAGCCPSLQRSLFHYFGP